MTISPRDPPALRSAGDHPRRLRPCPLRPAPPRATKPRDAPLLNFAVKRLGTEWLIVISNLPAAYRKRWAIECMFADANPRTTAPPETPGKTYPRGHGGTAFGMYGSPWSTGLSPLARLSLAPPLNASKGGGPIPVGTREPATEPLLRHCRGAYPRGHGGTPVGEDTLVDSRGLSPWARGNHRAPDLSQRGQGPIPVGTGEPLVGKGMKTQRCQRASRRVMRGAISA